MNLLHLLEFLVLILIWVFIGLPMVCLYDIYENIKELIEEIKLEYKEVKKEIKKENES